MAVVNTLNDALTHPQDADQLTGMRLLSVIKPITIDASDSDGSQFLIAEVPDSAILKELTIEGDAITGGTDYDIGIFLVDGTAITGKENCLMNAADMSDITGLPVGPFGEALRSGLSALTSADANKKVYELAGHVNKAYPAAGETLKKGKYRIGMTANTCGSESVVLVARLTYLMHV